MERMAGADAIFLHLERPDCPVHTLKVAVLDTSARGRPLALDEVRSAVGWRLGLVRRSTQRVVRAPGFGGRPFWVDDPDFDLDRHLGERTLEAPGDGEALDALYGELATRLLPRDRPLWDLTLVHGLAGGRQAVVFRVHHAVTDGTGVVGAFTAATAEHRGEPVPAWPPPPAEVVDRRAVLAEAVKGIGPWVAGLGPLVVDAGRNARRSRRFRATAPDLPGALSAPRTPFNAPSGGRRVCATVALPFGDLAAVRKATGATVNGVFHAVVAGAVRAELHERGADLSRPTVATFGIAADRGGDRRWGNAVTPTNALLFSNVADPLERLQQTARSCAEAVELRRSTGVEMAGRWAEASCRLFPLFRRAFADSWPRVVSHVTTANVPGPPEPRWVGDVEVAEWWSFAVAIPPSNVNLTAYSYAGRMDVGLVTTPEAIPEPRRFLAYTEEALGELVDLTSSSRSPRPPG
jgi:diacylglycerol O-acyltransferase / wax synthase